MKLSIVVDYSDIAGVCEQSLISALRHIIAEKLGIEADDLDIQAGDATLILIDGESHNELAYDFEQLVRAQIEEMRMEESEPIIMRAPD